MALADEVGVLLDYFEALAEDRGLALAVSGSGEVFGDGPMLRRAIANLLSNAIRHADRGSTVRVTIEAGGAEGPRLSVANRGSEIPADALPRLFDRFYRSDPARRRDGEGAGLGLAIARSIVRAHGGDIRVQSSGGETRFECRFPSSQHRPRTPADGAAPMVSDRA